MANRKYETVDERILTNIVRLAEQLIKKPEWIRRTYLRHSIGAVTSQVLDEVIKRHKIRTEESSNGVTLYNVADATDALCRIYDARLEQKIKSK